MRHLWLGLLLLTAPALAAYENPDEAFDLMESEVTPSTDDINRRRVEKLQHDEKMISEFDSDLGVTKERRWTGLDRNRISGALHLGGRYEFMRELQGFEFTWMRRVENWSKLWWGGTIRRAQTGFGEITQNRAPDGNTNSEGAFQRPKSADQTLTTMGLGAGYRFRLLTWILDTENTFETVNVFANRVTLDESFIKETYAGWGMSTDYGLHFRTRSSFFWGGKFTYNMAWVERAKRGTEAPEERSLSLGWYTLALEAGFFF
jgi:hypothetical protein